MLPSSTSNDSYDARRRRQGSPEGLTDAISPNDDSNVSDSSAERVAVPKRGLMRNRKQQSSQEENDINDTVIASKSSSLDEDNEACTQDELRISSSKATNKAGSFRHLYRKKLMSNSHDYSTKSLDSAADMLEKERLEGLHPNRKSPQRKTQSHYQRITLPLVDASITVSGAAAVTSPTVNARSGIGTGSSSLRSSLSDFKKSMRRHISIPSKQTKAGGGSKSRPTINQEVLTKESTSRSVPYSRRQVKVPTSDVTLQRRTWTASKIRKQLKRRGSDTDLDVMSLRPDSEDTETTGGKESTTKKPSRASTGSSAAVAASPGLVKKLWSSTQRVGGTSSGQPSNSSSSRRNLAYLDIDDEVDHDMPAVHDRDNATKVAAAALSAAIGSDDGSDDEADTNSRSKRKSKRVELVRELLSRDSLRIRDRARAAGGTLISQAEADRKGPLSLPAQPLKSDLPTEGELLKQSSRSPSEYPTEKLAAPCTDCQVDRKGMELSSLSPKLQQGSLPASSRHSQQSPSTPSMQLKSASSHAISSHKKRDERRRSSLGSTSSKRREGGSYTSLVNPDSRQDNSKKKASSRRERELKVATQDDTLQASKTLLKSLRRESPPSLSTGDNRGRDGAEKSRVNRKSPKTPPKTKNLLEGDASEHSLSVDDITRFDDSSTSLVDSSTKEVLSEEKKKKRRSRKKTERLSSSSTSWRASDGKSSRHKKSASDPNIGGKLFDSSEGMDHSCTEVEGSGNVSRQVTGTTRSRTVEKLIMKKDSSRRRRTVEDQPTRKIPVRSRTEEEPLRKKNASSKSGSSRSLGRSPKKPSGDGGVDKSRVEGDAKATDTKRKKSREGEPLKDTFSSLDAIANAPQNEIDLNEASDGPKARDSLDVFRLHALDIFHDSPDGSPLSNSVPVLWGSSAESSVMDRLVSSMPSLDYHDRTNQLVRSVRGRGELTSCSTASGGVDNEGIFQDDSDGSRSTQDLPDLDLLCDETHADVMTRIADQVDERVTPQSLQNLSHLSTRIPTVAEVESENVDNESKFEDDSDESYCTQELPDLESICDEPHQADVTTRIADQVDDQCLTPLSLQSHPLTNPSLSDFGTDVPTRSLGTDISSPIAARAVNLKKKLDRGPAIPRRSNSFEYDNESLGSTESSVEVETALADEEGAPVQHVNVSTSMQFHRTADNGWVETPLGSSRGHTFDGHSSAGTLHFPDSFEATPKAPGVRRRASMGDLGAAGASSSAADNRWQATYSSDTAPIVSRQSLPSITDRVSRSMGSDRLATLFSSPKRAARTKQLERTYLPVSLQSAARRFERARKQSPDKSEDMPRVKKEGSNTSDRATSRDARAGGVAVNTGLSDMFQMIGELEQDLVKFENQVAFLRAQRARRMEEDSTEDSTED